MGTTGTSTTNTNIPNTQIPQTQGTGLPDTADAATIQKYYSDNYGIAVGGSYFKDGCDPKVLARATEVLDRLAQELGKDKLQTMGIRIVSFKGMDPDAYAQTSIVDRRIAVNPNMFNSYDTVKAQMHRDVHSGFHPKGSKAADVIVHEVGHNIEFLINDIMSKGNSYNKHVAWNDQTYSKAIVQQAYADLNKANPGMFKDEHAAMRSISRYADSKIRRLTANGIQYVTAYAECFAEAVSDYVRNGQNAKPMSKKIWEGIKAMLT